MKAINIDVLHEQLFKEKPILAFEKQNDYSEWKKQVKEKYIELLGINEIILNDCELKVQVEEVKEFDTYTRYRYVFESEKNCFVPCYLLIPKSKEKKKWPVCICLQGHTSGFHISIGEKKYPEDDTWLKTSSLGLYAIENGFAALCIEQRGMGERTTPLKERGRALTCGCYHTAMTALLLGRTLIGERVWDVHKGIDSLSFFKKYLNLNDIIMTGNSGGGTTTYYAACYDERIKLAAPSCSISTYEGSIANVWHCSCNFIPRLSKYLNPGDLSCLIAPRKLVIVNGELDPIFLIDETKKVYNLIEKIYKKENVPNNFAYVINKGEGHKYLKDVVFGKIKEIREE